MSYPGFQAQQAARRANQAAMDSHRLAMRARQRGRRPSHWIVRLIGWLFTAAFLVVFLAVGAFVVLSVLHQTTP
jgi:hypothetical protein